MQRATNLGTAVLLAAIAPVAAGAQDQPFESGWHLDDRSVLSFTSVKDTDVLEESVFRSLSGGVNADGEATLIVALDSVDTAIGIRDDRLRYILFGTPRHPTATVGMKIEPYMIEGLEEEREIVVRAPYTLTFRGTDHVADAQLALALTDDGYVTVSSVEPVTLDLADLGLLGGLAKLENLAGVSITPSTDLTFDLIFAPGPAPEPVRVAALGATAPAPELLDLEGCAAALAKLSTPGNVSFESGSGTLQEASLPLLDRAASVIARCPDTRIEVGGHTDSDGSRNQNHNLSHLRGDAVVDYLARQGLDPARFKVVGYGEGTPAVPNTSPANKALNRRIEFRPIDG